MDAPDNPSLLSQGNAAFRAQDYEQALLCYQRALRQVPEALRPSLEFNIELTRRRLVARLGDAAQQVLQRITDQLRLEDEINVVTPHFDRDYYLAKNPDVAQAGIEPVLHYCCQGWREGRDPHPDFSTAYYLESNPDVREAGICPYWHYIVAGKNEGRQPRPDAAERAVASSQAATPLEKPGNLDDYFFNLIKESGLFDPDWYLAQYGAKYEISGNPLAHYLEHGVAFGTNPSPGFDTTYYVKANPDVAACGLQPFLHYVCQGHKEGRRPKPPLSDDDLEIYPVEEARYVPRLPPDAPPVEKAVRVIAFYLPQFHPIPENDKWWGEGFTEWTNVRPAQPQFEGHYQPHVPDDFLGYYDLRDTSVMRKQIELAKQYGIEGFCFYVYWFGGKRLLEKPVDNYLADPSLDLPFCICWANENWSRRWDGSDNEILIAQEYSDSHDIEFIADMAKYLKDERYIRVAGKPLLIIYRPNLLPDMKRTATLWRNWAHDNGIGDLFIAYVQSFDDAPPEKYGLDAAIEFPPSGWYTQPEKLKIKPHREFNGKIYDWRVLLKASENYLKKDKWLFRGLCPSWDNTPRRKKRSTIFHLSSPALFTKWLVNAFVDTRQRIEEHSARLVFVNAWNEWAEGAHLEPDSRYGYAWLNAIRTAHSVAGGVPRFMLVTHDAFPSGAQLLMLSISKYLLEKFGIRSMMLTLGGGALVGKYYENSLVRYVNPKNDDALSVVLTEARRFGIKAAIVNTAVSGLVAPFLKRSGFKVVSLVHELPGILTNYRLHEHAQAIAEHADHVVFAAPQVKEGFESFLGRPVEQSVIRPQGLYQRSWLRAGADKAQIRRQVRQQLGLPEDAQLILCAGYADHRKGFDLFVEVGMRLLPSRPSLYFLWVGHREEGFCEQVLAKAERAGLRQRFLFTGLVDEPQPYYLAADVYALTSREDPFPSVVMEALDSLTPVVAFQGAGGFEELLKRGCGLLVPKEDTAAYADALGQLLDNPAMARALAETGRETVERELSFHHYLFDLLDLAGVAIPRVSAIVPNYRYGRYLRDRLSSVVNQTHPLCELIVLDDCSPDDSVAVAQEFLRQCEIPWCLEVNSVNSGSVFRQWRKGIEMSRGEYVWIAEADDTSLPNFLERLLPRMQETGAVLGFADSWQIDEEGNRLGDSYKPYVNEENPGAFDQSFVMDGQAFLERYLSIKNVILNVSGVVFRRDALLAALDRVGDELFDYKVAGDWRLYVELCAQGGKFVYESEPLNGHRRHKTSVTHHLEGQRHFREIESLHAKVGELTSLCKEGLDLQTRYRERVKEYLCH